MSGNSDSGDRKGLLAQIQKGVKLKSVKPVKLAEAPKAPKGLTQALNATMEKFETNVSTEEVEDWPVGKAAEIKLPLPKKPDIAKKILADSGAAASSPVPAPPPPPSPPPPPPLPPSAMPSAAKPPVKPLHEVLKQALHGRRLALRENEDDDWENESETDPKAKHSVANASTAGTSTDPKEPKAAGATSTDKPALPPRPLALVASAKSGKAALSLADVDAGSSSADPLPAPQSPPPTPPPPAPLPSAAQAFAIPASTLQNSQGPAAATVARTKSMPPPKPKRETTAASVTTPDGETPIQKELRELKGKKLVSGKKTDITAAFERFTADRSSALTGQSPAMNQERAKRMAAMQRELESAGMNRAQLKTMVSLLETALPSDRGGRAPESRTSAANRAASLAPAPQPAPAPWSPADARVHQPAAQPADSRLQAATSSTHATSAQQPRPQPVPAPATSSRSDYPAPNYYGNATVYNGSNPPPPAYGAVSRNQQHILDQLFEKINAEPEAQAKIAHPTGRLLDSDVSAFKTSGHATANLATRCSREIPLRSVGFGTRQESGRTVFDITPNAPGPVFWPRHNIYGSNIMSGGKPVYDMVYYEGTPLKPNYTKSFIAREGEPEEGPVRSYSTVPEAMRRECQQGHDAALKDQVMQGRKTSLSIGDGSVPNQAARLARGAGSSLAHGQSQQRPPHVGRGRTNSQIIQ